MAPRINGVRGVALLVGALYCWIRGYAYIPIGDSPSELPGGLQLLSSFVPLAVWACAWLGSGLLCAISAFRTKDFMAWGLLVAMMTTWAGAYLVGWIISFSSPDGMSREYLNASTYGLPAVMIYLLSSRLAPSREVMPDGSS